MSKLDPSQTRKRRPFGETKNPKKTFCIYCEGQTEKIYFETLKTHKRLSNISIKIIELNKNGNALTLTKEAISQKQKDKKYDQYWIVLDKDDTKEEDFEKAIQECESRNINVAYSIRSFEVWILFHYKYFEQNLSQVELENEISHFCKNKYSKSSKDLESLCKELISKLDVAKQNAKKSFEKFENEQILVSKRESCSRVYVLVEKLLL